VSESSFDVICVGSGGGGLSAAITAADAGMSVVVLEKSSQIGGTCAYSDGQIWVGANRLAREAGMPDSPVETRQYLEFLSMGVAEASLRDNFVERAPEAVNFLIDCGVALQVIRGLADYHYPNAPGSKQEGRYLEVVPVAEAELGELADLVQTSPHGNGWMTNQEVMASESESEMTAVIARHVERRERCTGAGLAAALAKAAAERAAHFRPSTAAVRLVMRDGRVDGVVIRDESGQSLLHARRGVVLATGGYDYSPVFMKAFELEDEVYSMAPATTTGDHLILGSRVGAAIVKTRLPETSQLTLGLHTPGDEHEGSPKYRYCLPALAHSILVNRRGRRFGDEKSRGIKPRLRDLDDRGDAANWPTWLILDQNYREKFTLGAVGPGDPLPVGMADSADTIRELAEIAGIDPTGLEETIARWNEFCARGADEDFGRGSTLLTTVVRSEILGRIDRPPFLAVKLSWLSLNTPSAGLRITANAEAVDIAGNPISGVFVAGNAAASVDTGARYQSGLGNSRGLTYGYLAARTMVARQG
jgi:hypothetical protein